MPALNFQERFADLVVSGEKRQTIRPVRKRPIKISDTLYLYTGMRMKRCRKLGTAVCLNIQRVTIYIGCFSLQSGRFGPLNEYGAEVNLNKFAQGDGFDDWPEMQGWFDKRYGLPFEGVLIQW